LPDFSPESTLASGAKNARHREKAPISAPNLPQPGGPRQIVLPSRACHFGRGIEAGRANEANGLASGSWVF